MFGFQLWKWSSCQAKKLLPVSSKIQKLTYFLLVVIKPLQQLALATEETQRVTAGWLAARGTNMYAVYRVAFCQISRWHRRLPLSEKMVSVGFRRLTLTTGSFDLLVPACSNLMDPSLKVMDRRFVQSSLTPQTFCGLFTGWIRELNYSRNVSLYMQGFVTTS